VGFVLPKVENPIPDTIGLGAIFSLAGAGGVLSLVIATLLGFPDRQRDAWSRWGMALGFAIGSGVYLISLLAQVL
jgi:hypothetical protein